LCVGDCIARRIHNAVDDPWFGKEDFRRQSADIFGGRDRNGSVPTLSAHVRCFGPGQPRRKKAGTKSW
jgi:hypothetical protein